VVWKLRLQSHTTKATSLAGPKVVSTVGTSTVDNLDEVVGFQDVKKKRTDIHTTQNRVPNGIREGGGGQVGKKVGKKETQGPDGGFPKRPLISALPASIVATSFQRLCPSRPADPFLTRPGIRAGTSVRRPSVVERPRAAPNPSTTTTTSSVPRTRDGVLLPVATGRHPDRRGVCPPWTFGSICPPTMKGNIESAPPKPKGLPIWTRCERSVFQPGSNAIVRLRTRTNQSVNEWSPTWWAGPQRYALQSTTGCQGARTSGGESSFLAQQEQACPNTTSSNMVSRSKCPMLC